LTAAASSWAVATNGFSSQRWEPFAEWLETNHADDVVVVYTDHDQDDVNIDSKARADATGSWSSRRVGDA
jgi:hypothetical protein